MSRSQLRMTASQEAHLRQHLFPGDGLEAVAFFICGRLEGPSRQVLTAERIVPVPHEACDIRQPNLVSWNTDILDQMLPLLFGTGRALVKVHSHPGGYSDFSPVDDRSDKQLYASVASLLGDDNLHASVVLTPESMFGRSVSSGENEILFGPLEIMVVGDDLKLYGKAQMAENFGTDSQLRTAQAFGRGTTGLLSGCSAALVGCSGTGSVVAEQLARLGMGKIVLIDPDVIEDKNLSRIINSRGEHATQGRYKTDVLADAIARMGTGCDPVSLPVNLITKLAVRAVADCDFVFGCMDGAEGRHLLNRLATFYTMPYWDIGVRLDSDGLGGIDNISGAVNYVQPGLSSLLTREVYDMEQVRAEGLRRTNPELYSQQLKEGYIKGAGEDRPAVISVNMLYASLCVNDFLARLHRFRNCANGDYARVVCNLCEFSLICEPEAQIDEAMARHLGRGDVYPLLDRPDLS